ncbi:MAG: PAS domain-containing protein [Syntrophobacteraceae bacterium]|nr:PAS domain-containing protein [Syntrophobacteraceae bacterium]
MGEHEWVREFPGAIVVCDTGGTIVEMNDRAVAVFGRKGGDRLIGSNILDCHPEPARSRLEILMRDQQPNIYTVEKEGARKMIVQVPWHRRGVYSGFMELQIELPGDVPHYVR